MNRREAEATLSDDEVVPCLEAPMDEAKRLLEVCLDADIPAIIWTDPSCKGCAPKVQLLVRPPDVPRVAVLMQERWRNMAEREGTLLERPAAAAGANETDEPPCPACGATAALVDGACPDCGLALG